MKSLKDENIFKVNSMNLNIDVEEVLINKGFEFTIRGDWISMRCPFPDHDDSNPSFFIHKYHLGWNCYSGCGSGNWFDFIDKMGWEIEEIEDISVNQLPLALWKEFKDNLRKKKKTESPCKIPNGFKIITNYESSRKHYDYLKKRNITDLVSTFNIGFTNEFDSEIRNDGKHLYGGVYKDRIIIPCHNEIGKMIWLEGRYIGKKKIDNKYWRPKGIDKTKYLFNFHRVKKKGYKWVIVVEGIIDAMILWYWGIPAVCCYGSVISEDQLGVLMEFNKVYVCLDNDKAGIKGWFKVKDKLDSTGIETLRIIMPRNKDVNDITKEQFINRYTKARKI